MIQPFPVPIQTQASLPQAERHFPREAEVSLRDALKRCSASTVEAACAYRQTGRPEYLSVIVYGIVERYVERELRPKLRSFDHTLRLVDDLGVDSLTMMEIVMLVEEVIPISINYEDLRSLHTIADVERYLSSRHHSTHRSDA